MYRVVTTYRNGSTHPIIERGPWHPSRHDAEFWAEQLREAGYAVNIESQRVGGADGADDHAELASALASMA